MTNQNKVMEKQNFESTFFQLLRLYNEVIDELSVDSTSAMDVLRSIGGGASATHILRGRQCFPYLLEFLLKLLVSNSKVSTPDGSELTAINDTYREFYAEHGNSIGHYFRTIYNIVKFVDESAIEETSKRKFTNLLRAQLSKEELSLLFYNCISEYGRERMKPLVKKYDLLQHLEESTLVRPGVVDWL